MMKPLIKSTRQSKSPLQPPNVRNKEEVLIWQEQSVLVIKILNK